jgi:Bacterial PH domain
MAETRVLRTWRPRFAPVVAGVVGTGLVIASFGMWFGLPAEARADFSWIQVVTLVIFLVAILTGLAGIARTRLSADESGLTVVNVFRLHRLEWAQVLGVNLRTGDPWVQLDLDDGTTLGVMAIQSADGEHGRNAARQLAVLVADRSRTARDD